MLFAYLTATPSGPVTDYGATITHWQHDRVPNYRGGYAGEAERPSPSYIVNVSSDPLGRSNGADLDDIDAPPCSSSHQSW